MKSSFEKVESDRFYIIISLNTFYTLNFYLYFTFYLLTFKTQHFVSNYKPSIKSFLYYSLNTNLKLGKTNFELTTLK